MRPKKYYIVWEGRQPGVYETWGECKAQIHKFPKAKYKSFKGISREKAELLFEEGSGHLFDRTGGARVTHYRGTMEPLDISEVNPDGIAVDASTIGNPGPTEYRGVVVSTKDVVFSSPLYPQGTNNIGEFLAIVYAMAWLKKNDYYVPIYSDSLNAIIWVQHKKCRTKLERNAQTELIFEHIEWAEKWLAKNDLTRYEIIKWQTKEWGEIPADYGRK